MMNASFSLDSFSVLDRIKCNYHILPATKHLDDRLKQELAKLDKWSKNYVMNEAIGKIFEHIDWRFYYLSAKPLLDWRLE